MDRTGERPDAQTDSRPVRRAAETDQLDEDRGRDQDEEHPPVLRPVPAHQEEEGGGEGDSQPAPRVPGAAKAARRSEL